MLISESWGKDETETELEKKFNANVYTSSRKNRNGGGVMIIASKSIFVEKRWKYSDEATQMVAIYSPNLNTALIACYVPPAYNYINKVNAFDELRGFLNTMQEDTNIVAYGDYNLNCLRYERNEDDELEPMICGGPLKEEEGQVELSGNAANRAIANKLIELSDEFNLSQIIVNPTFRKQEGRGKSFLDRIFPNIVTRSEVQHIESNKTRHDVLRVQMEISINKEMDDEEQEEVEVLNTKNIDYVNARKELEKVNWEEILTAEKAYVDMEKVKDEIMKAVKNNGAK